MTNTRADSSLRSERVGSTVRLPTVAFPRIHPWNASWGFRDERRKPFIERFDAALIRRDLPGARLVQPLPSKVVWMIRAYTATDCDEVVAVWYDASMVAHPFLSEDFFASERKQIIENHLPSAETYVSVSNGAVVGFISLIGNEVGAIFVDPRSARRGVGRALMNHARSIHGNLELDVFEENTIGRALYRKYGFREIGQKKDDRTGRILLRLSLAG